MALERAFTQQRIAPDIVISAIDSEVIKAYVKIGLGVAVLPTIAFVRKADAELGMVDVTRLFGAASSALILHPEAYLREFMYDFIAQVAPRWTRHRMRAAFAMR
jgi:LysR family transcriptional regulator, cys regulon transcriptional activator